MGNGNRPDARGFTGALRDFAPAGDDQGELTAVPAI